MGRKPENTVLSWPKGAGKSTLNKIAKLARKKGNELVSVKTGKKFIAFTYRTNVGVFCRSYPSMLEGLRKELNRLA